MKLTDIAKGIVEANALVTTKSGTKSVEYKNPSELDDLKKDSNVTSVETTSGQKLKEMARTPIRYKLTTDYVDKLTELPYFNLPKKMVWVNGIIDYLNQEGPSSIATIAKEKFNKQQQQLSGFSIDMVRHGIITPEIEGTVPQFMRTTTDTPEEITPTDATMASEDSELAKYFDGAPNADDSEDFNDDIEPTLPKDVDDDAKVMSDEDFEAFMKYDDLKQRLNSTKSNILKAKQQTSTPGDIGGKPSTELVRLRDLKKSLEERIAVLVANSEYLQKKEAGELPSDSSKHQYVTRYKKEEVPVPVIEPENKDEEETLEESQIRIFKYYAGITK